MSAKEYVPHPSLLKHPHWRDSNMYHICSQGHAEISRVGKYLSVNEESAEEDFRYWDFSRRAFLAAVRWDYERQLKGESTL